MTREIGLTYWLLTLALFFARPSAAQNSVDRLEHQLESFALQLRASGIDLTFEKPSPRGLVEEPLKEMINILDTAQILIDHDGTVQVRNLRDLDFSRDQLDEMAKVLVSRGLIQRGDQLAAVKWSIGERSFQTLAAVHKRRCIRSWLNRVFFRSDYYEPLGFEPILFFTPARIEESRAADLFTGDQSGLAGQPLQPKASGSLLTALAIAPFLAFEAEEGKLWKPKQKLEIRNGYGTCVTVIWGPELRTDGCKIFNPRPYTRVWSQTTSFFCPFWDVETIIREESYQHSNASGHPLPGSCKEREDCLKSILKAHPLLSLFGRTIHLVSLPSVTQDVCCHEIQ